MRNCPGCGSTRIKPYNRHPQEFYCPKCESIYKIASVDVPVCFKCERKITDYSKATLWGSNKEGHNRCRRRPTDGALG